MSSIDTNALTVSNFQSTADVQVSQGNGVFSGFSFSQLQWGADGLAYLELGGGGWLRSNGQMQRIAAQASVDYSLPVGYLLKEITLQGYAADDGPLVGEAYGVSAPCIANFYNGGGSRLCRPDNQSGTISAWMNMHSELSGGFRADQGVINNPRLMLAVEYVGVSEQTSHIPEPSYEMLLGGLLVAVFLFGRRR